MRAALLAAVLLSGCAGRYLSIEEDEQMRAKCHPLGCVVVPAQHWQSIEWLLQRLFGKEA